MQHHLSIDIETKSSVDITKAGATDVHSPKILKFFCLPVNMMKRTYSL